jgi:hypothetical protein
MKAEKIFGWCLLLAGLFIIFWSLWFSFKVFKGEKKFFEIFKLEEKSLEKETPAPKTMEEKVKKEISENLNKILPKREISKLLNLISLSIFVGIFIFGGGKIASLGIELIKK